MRKIALSLFSLVLSAALLSWGVTGHRTIGKIAANHLTPQATAAVRELIGDTTLAEISTWPDEVRSQPAYRNTATWHYINLPLGLSFTEFEAKVKGMTRENVYSALLRQEQILGSTASTRPQKVEALKYIVHFVGDLHQPMHVSREEDKGGNTIQLNYDGNGTNLHALWDSKLIDHQGLTYEQMAEKYDHATAAQIRQWQSEPLIQWIWESYQVSSRLYAEVDAMKSRTIDDSYYQAHIGIIGDRIEKAGIRLAGVLNEIFRNGLAASAAPAPVTNAGNAPAGAPASTPTTIAVRDAARHYNEYINVCARVYGIKALDNLTLVDLGAAYPNQQLTIVLRDAARDMGSALDGKTICVTGTVVSYRDKPEIVVTDPGMIVVSGQ
ncbi:MAG TPA: S1/P1 nuclease [Puia sp.]|nr:S1/P1 nuclease [Puia sp.]